LLLLQFLVLGAPLKIVMLCDFYNESLEYQENLLVKYYVKHGHAVTVITSTFESVFDYYADRHDKQAPARTYQHGGATVIKLKYRFNVLNRLRAFTRIDRLLDEAEPDLIFVHDIMLNFPEAVRYVKKHPACRMIMDYHADYSNSGANALSRKVLHGVIRKWYLDRARPYLSRIFPIVPASATFLHEIYKVPHSEMEVLPLGADIDLANEVKQEQSGKKLRHKLGIPDDHIVIFTGGKLAPAKKTELLIEAVAKSSVMPLHLVIVGEAAKELDAYRKQLACVAQGHANIHFVGWLGQKDIYRYMDMADIAVFPASQSILWQQAIAMGLPLIVGNSGHQDISYLNLHNNIIILSRDDIRSDKLMQTIEIVVSDTERIGKMHEGAKLVARQQLDWNNLFLRTLRFNKPTGISVDHEHKG
jgi:1,2-diacylglycerol 3-alpha-glucosyltransferase